MRDAVEKIHRAIDGINDPLTVRLLIARYALLAIERVARTSIKQNPRDQFLRLLVQRELDVVMAFLVHLGDLAEMFVQEFSRFQSGMGGKGKVGHEKVGGERAAKLRAQCQ